MLTTRASCEVGPFGLDTIEHSHGIPALLGPMKSGAFSLVWFQRDEVSGQSDEDWYGCNFTVEFHPGHLKIYHESSVSAGWEFGGKDLFNLSQVEGDGKYRCLLADLLPIYFKSAACFSSIFNTVSRTNKINSE